MSSRPQNGVTLVLGPPNSGKRGLVMEWWQERLSCRPVVVMPTAPDADDMSAEMARRTRGLVSQSPAVTLAGLAQTVIGRPCRSMDGFRRGLVICDLLRSTTLTALGDSVHLPGIADSVGALLLELLESGQSTPEIVALLKEWAMARPGESALADDLARLLVGYERAVATLGLVERPMTVREAARAALGWDRPVALYGFTSLTPGQRALVEELADRTEVLMTLTYERARSVGLCAREEVEWWTERAVEVLEVNPRARAYASPGVAYLEGSFLSIEPPKSPPPARGETEGVRFLLASGRRAEAELAAQHIAGLIRAGFDPEGIAVVVRHVPAWGSLLQEVFASCGIACRIDERRRLRQSGLGHAFLEALRGVVQDDAEPLLSYLRGPYSGIAAEQAADLEALYRQGFGRGSRVLASLATGRVGEALRAVWSALRPAAVDPAVGQVAQTLDLAGAGALAESMLLAGIRGLAAEDRELEADARAFRAVQAGLAAMSTVAPVMAAGMDALASLRLLSQVEVAEPMNAGLRAVKVLSAQRARARRFEVVFVLGLVEGEFPSIPDMPGLLSAARRAALDEAAGGILSSAYSDESALFAGAISRAWRLLYLSARDSEDDGGEAIPSRFWERAKTILGVDASDHARRTLADQVFTPDLAPSLRHYARACAAAGQAVGPDGAAPAGERSAPLWRRATPRLCSPRVLAELQASDCFTPSGLETYLRCPFAWFVERVIGREDVEPALDGRTLGELVHVALGECYRRLAGDGRLPLKTADLPLAERQMGTLIDELVLGPDCPGSPAERRVASWRLKTMACRVLRSEAACGGEWGFSEAETKVGGDDGVDIGGLRLRGRIDRLDTTSDGERLFVIDYKSGSAPAASAIGTAEALQLPLYLEALAAERGDDHVAGGAYLSLSDGTLSGVVKEGARDLLGCRASRVRGLDEAGWQELCDGTREVAESAAAGMRGGVIAPQTRSTCPEWCDLGPACRSRRAGQRL